MPPDSIEPGGWRPHPQRQAVAKHGMVTSQHWLASKAGQSLFAKGGNAMDAAVATAFALGVVEPAASGLGGQTMMLIYDAQSSRKIALDGSSRAPNRIQPGRYKSRDLYHGHKATTVPSTPATLAWALERYGSMTLAQVLTPAIELAENGYFVSQLQHDLAEREREPLIKFGAAKLFLQHGKRPYKVGQTFRQPALAATLKRLADCGIEDFYQGDIAQQIVDDMQANHGLLQLDDLAQIPWPVERKPLSANVANNRLFTFPEPGAGRVLIEALNIFSHLPEKLQQIDSARGAVALAEVIRRANCDRRDRPFDRDIHPQVPEERMLKNSYAQKVAEQIGRSFRKPKTRGETTHLTTMDGAGNTVALTQSIEQVYGSCAASPELGFVYNNYMTAFEFEDIAHPYYLRPNAVPWASVMPSILFRNNRPYLALGSPGSERISSTLLQVLIRLLFDKDLPLDAVSAPRLHCSAKGKVSLEGARMRNDIPELLSKRGFTLDDRGAFAFYLGCVQLVIRQRGELLGVADPRRDGSAEGC